MNQRVFLISTEGLSYTGFQSSERTADQDPAIEALWSCCVSYFCSMLITMLRAKLHRLTVTQADLNYIGSITLDPDLLDAAGLFEGEKVQIVNINNGERFETYTILGERGSGQVGLNGPAARRVQVGDVIIIIAYGHMTPEEAKSHQPRLVFPDTATNKLTS